MPILMLVPLLALLGVFGETFAVINARNDSFAMEVLVQRGEFVADTMNKERISPEEVFAEMHQVGLYQLSQVKWAVLETDGRISFVPETDNLPGTPVRSEQKEIE